GGAQLLAGLALFDRERAQIDASWAWASERASDAEADALLLEYIDALTYIGELRYDKRRERIPQLEVGLAAARRLGRKDAEGPILGTLGMAYAELGETQKAIDYQQQCLAVAREIGDRNGEAAALGNLGIAYAELGETQKAIEFFEQALAIAREIGDQNGEAIISWNLGGELAEQGGLARATELMHMSVKFEQEIGHPDAKEHAAQLEEVRGRGAGGGGSGGTADE
ncbi:MAG: tetratricopeptide repeat protein, partial [Chloroflexota bacterium]|nr:tetratricopeptide repeat protein [Chloroflexota bacterium]